MQMLVRNKDEKKKNKQTHPKSLGTLEGNGLR